MSEINRIKELRKERGITQRRLALDLGITDSYVATLERGVRAPGFQLGKKISEYFGVSIDYMNFFDDQEDGKGKAHE